MTPAAVGINLDRQTPAVVGINLDSGVYTYWTYNEELDKKDPVW